MPGAVLFTRAELDSRQSLWRVESDGTGLRRLGWGGSPSWSPTKDRYAFELDGEINVANADGSGAHRVGPARVDPGMYDYEADWSPDGSRLAFIRQASNSSELWVVGTDGSGARPIVGANANGAASVRSPRWDRNGRAVRFTARLTPGTNSIGLESIVVDGPASPSIVIQPTADSQAICYVESAGGQRQAYLFADAMFMTICVEEAGRERVEPFGSGTGLGCPRWANPDWLFSRVFDNGAHRLRFAHVDGRSFDVPDITDVYDATF